MSEIAAEMDLGLRTVEKEWGMARAWMRRELRQDEIGDLEPAAERSAARREPIRTQGGLRHGCSTLRTYSRVVSCG